MKKILPGILFICCFCQSYSQTDSIPDSVNVNALAAPSSPAFDLLGVSPSSVQSPTDLTAFKLSVQNATNNFTSFPSNYAVDISPAKIFNTKNQTLTTFDSKKFKYVFWQSLDLSLGIIKSDSNDVAIADSNSFTKFGIGIKFSIIRPHWIDSTQKSIDSLYFWQDKINKNREKLFNTAEIKVIEDSMKLVNNLPITAAEKIAMIDSLNERKKRQQIFLLNDTTIFKIKAQIKNDSSRMLVADSASRANLKRLASGLVIKRKGGFLDFATGMVLDFPDEKFSNSNISKAGAWLTGGYQNTKEHGLSLLAIARYLYQPDKIFADDTGKINATNISTFDVGGKLDLRGANGKLSLNFEAIYRSVLNKNIIDPSWRAVFNASYNVGMNKLLTFSFGKNFDGTITKGGNLIAAINFVTGFGSSKGVTKTKPSN